MTTLSPAHLSAVLLAAIGSLFAVGCAHTGPSSDHARNGALSCDAQESVELALRRHPDPEAVRDAVVTFSEACKEGQAASCSAMGVMYELGLGVRMDTGRARALYGVACGARNFRACENLDALRSAEMRDFYEQVATNQP
jgi:TPR repeat protein